MSADQNGLARLRSQARQARTEGQFRQAARFERQAVELAQALGLASERVQALLWEGYSLRQAGEEDLALAALLQAASERATTADPADVFAALVAVIHISLERKPPAFCRALLDEGRRYLTDLRQPWNGLLDYLEGELAYREGHWAVAWEWYCRAWAGRRAAHPCLTAATHLWALCRTAFRRHDLAELERWIARLSELTPSDSLDRQLQQRARLLGWRARRAAGVACADAATDAQVAEIAQALLAEVTQGAQRDTGVRHEVLRVLALLSSPVAR